MRSFAFARVLYPTYSQTKRIKIDADEKRKTKQNRFYQKYLELRRRINAHSCPVLPATLNTGSTGVNSSTANSLTVQRSASLKEQLRYEKHDQH